jgi:GMP synthase-like glutamine amidotransferase
MDEVVLVNTDPLATRKRLGDLEKIIHKNIQNLNGEYGYVTVARGLRSEGIDYIPVLGNDYQGHFKNHVHLVTGVPVNTPYSLSEETQRDGIINDYSWMLDHYGVYGICMGFQIMTTLWGEDIKRLKNKQAYSKLVLSSKWTKKKKLKCTANHLDASDHCPAGFVVLAQRKGIIYKIANWNMGHIGVQYHPEFNRNGRIEMIRDILYLMKTMKYDRYANTS